LRREDDIDASVRGNAESVRERFRGGKGPAASALALISDGVNTSGPLLRGIEEGRDISDTFVVVDGDILELEVVNEVGTQKFASDFSKGHTIELGWDSSLPATDLVQVVSEFLAQDLVIAQEDCVHSGTDPVAEFSEVLGIETSNSLRNFIHNFDVVDQETLANIVEERDGALEGFDHLEEGLEVNISSLADLDSVRDNLSSLTNEFNTGLDSCGVLGGNVSNGS
jgi:hypothetical protein